MLRLLVVAVLLANLLFFSWSRGWLDSVVGTPARGDREPQRLVNQVRPEQVKLWPAAELVPAPEAAASASDPAPASTSTSASPTAVSAAAEVAASAASPGAMRPGSATAPTAMMDPGAARPPVAAAASSASLPASAATANTTLVCLETGPYVGAELATVEAALRSALPAGSWSERKVEGGEWMIYMGPYPDRDWLERKQRELARIRGGVPQDEVTAPPELARGISLGRYPSQAAGAAALNQYKNRGIRTARVVRVSGVPAGSYLRVDQADGALASRVTALKLPLAGRTFTACPR